MGNVEFAIRTRLIAYSDLLISLNLFMVNWYLAKSNWYSEPNLTKTLKPFSLTPDEFRQCCWPNSTLIAMPINKTLAYPNSKKKPISK